MSLWLSIAKQTGTSTKKEREEKWTEEEKKEQVLEEGRTETKGEKKNKDKTEK